MKRILNVLFIFSLLILNVSAQTSMFRGSPDHSSSYTSINKITFTDQAWAFNANAPIRSTAVVSSKSVYFGTSDGKFYSLDRRSGKINWTYNSGAAIGSSPAVDGNLVYFSNNKQTLFAINAGNGKLLWKYDFGPNRNYDWAFDYFYSSPTIAGNYDQGIGLGSDDCGCAYKTDIEKDMEKISISFKNA